jgi:hypothetical protein
MTKYPKLFAIVAGIAIALAASPSAWATGVKPPAPQPTPSPAAEALAQQQQGQQQGQDQSQSIGDVTGGQGGAGGSVGNVTSGGATSLSGAQSGDSRAAATADSYSATGDVSNMIGGSKYLSLPQPVWTTVPTPYGCLVTESKAGAIGWNFASGSSSKQFSDAVCTTIRMAEAAYLHCQYLTAAHLNRRAFETMHPGESGGFFLAGNPENLDPVQCDALKRPVLRMTPVIAPATPVPSVTSISVTAPQPECPKPQTRIVYRDKPAQKPCVNCCK